MSEDPAGWGDTHNQKEARHDPKTCHSCQRLERAIRRKYDAMAAGLRDEVERQLGVDPFRTAIDDACRSALRADVRRGGSRAANHWTREP